MQWFIQVPRLCWFTPMVQSESTRRLLSANTSASSWISSAGMPESSEAYSRV